jgi:putative colanic acid biosynthesis UDP-glucose lipid carrier transferase
MHRASNVLIRGKIFADLSLLTLINYIAQSNLNDQGFFSRSGLLLFFASLVCWMFSARAAGLYHDFRVKPFSQEWVAFIKSLILYTLLISFIFFHFLNQHFFGRPHMMLHCSLIFILFPFQKLIFRIVSKKLRNSRNLVRKVLIVGAGDTGLNFYEQYVKDEHFGFKLTGFIDDVKNSSLNGHYLGKTSEIDEVMAKYELDDIIVTLPITKERQIEKIVSAGEKQGKRVRIIPNYHQFGDGKFDVGRIGSLPIITLRSLPLDFNDNKVYKRVFDIVFSLFVIVFIFSWLFPIIGILIKFSSKGTVFFKQERWGLNNKVITCYKFRSMVCTSKDVDEKGNYMQAQKNDSRITWIGKFLRKTNLDELPQFINVFLGSMSVVGPRPHPVPLNMQSKDNVEKYMMRHWVKPGITGWAQTNGFRGETREPTLMRRRVEHDLWYIENWTYWLDLQIILQTLVNMVKGEENAF